ACRFKAETVPVEIPGKQRPTVIDKDEGPRKDTSLEALAALKPSFEKDGSVTPGNAPGLNDGASALVVASLEFAQAHGLKPLARVTAYATGGGDPKDLFFAPIVAVRSLLAQTKTTIADYDLIEANEAFAVQALADGRALGWDWARVNVNGGAIALGHPIGASGARVLTTLLYALKDKQQTTGLATRGPGSGSTARADGRLSPRLPPGRVRRGPHRGRRRALGAARAGRAGRPRADPPGRPRPAAPHHGQSAERRAARHAAVPPGRSREGRRRRAAAA